MGGGTTSKFFASKPPATVQTSLRQEPGSPTLPTPSSSTAQQWRFVPSSEQDPASTHTEHEDAEKARRHEAFRKALLGPRDPFAHRASLADARSVEELRQLQADADASAIPDDELGEDEDDPEEIVEVMKPKKGKAKAKAAPAPEEDGESDPGFKSLMAGFASGTRKVKSKPKAAPKPKKAEAPLGPCGLPYTPLELQVLELKKAHPGTLLMVEVGYKYLFYEEDARVGPVLHRTENERMLTDTSDSCKGARICCLPKAQFTHSIDARGPTRRASQKVNVASGGSGDPHSHVYIGSSPVATRLASSPRQRRWPSSRLARARTSSSPVASRRFTPQRPTWTLLARQTRRLLSDMLDRHWYASSSSLMRMAVASRGAASGTRVCASGGSRSAQARVMSSGTSSKASIPSAVFREHVTHGN
jgi:hypothetical protein